MSGELWPEEGVCHLVWGQYQVRGAAPMSQHLDISLLKLHLNSKLTLPCERNQINNKSCLVELWGGSLSVMKFLVPSVFWKKSRSECLTYTWHWHAFVSPLAMNSHACHSSVNLHIFCILIHTDLLFFLSWVKVICIFMRLMHNAWYECTQTFPSIKGHHVNLLFKV